MVGGKERMRGLGRNCQTFIRITLMPRQVPLHPRRTGLHDQQNTENLSSFP